MVDNIHKDRPRVVKSNSKEPTAQQKTSQEFSIFFWFAAILLLALYVKIANKSSSTVNERLRKHRLP